MHTVCLAFLLSVFGRFLLRHLGRLAKSLAVSMIGMVGALFEAGVWALRPSCSCLCVWVKDGSVCGDRWRWELEADRRWILIACLPPCDGQKDV